MLKSIPTLGGSLTRDVEGGYNEMRKIASISALSVLKFIGNGARRPRTTRILGEAVQNS
jgi:hypothetical protein